MIDPADSLRGSQRRRFRADTVDRLGLGQRPAQRLFGWDRDRVSDPCQTDPTVRTTPLYDRLSGLPKWFIEIPPASPDEA